MLHLPLRFVFVIFQSIFHFASEIILCRLQVLSYRLPIIDTLLQLPYPALFLTNITVANPYLLSYNLTSSASPTKYNSLQIVVTNTEYFHYRSFSHPSFTFYFCLKFTFPIPSKYVSCKIFRREEFSVFLVRSSPVTKICYFPDFFQICSLKYIFPRRIVSFYSLKFSSFQIFTHPEFSSLQYYLKCIMNTHLD